MPEVEVVVGVVGRAHGIKGELNVDPVTDEPDVRFAPGSVLHAEGRPEQRFTVRSVRNVSGRLVVAFAECTDRSSAEALRGVVLAAHVDAAARPEEPDAFYDRHLVGLAVLNARGEQVGRVTAVHHPGAQDLLVVETAAGERLVPFVRALVPEVDLATGHVRLADVAGLIDDQGDAPLDRD